MLAAIISTDARVWFFKMVGANELVGGHVDEFRQLIESVTLESPGADPQWKLPANWSAAASSGMRLATLKAGDSEQAPEVSVIGLPAPQDVDANINRWRGQLQLPPMSEGEAAERIALGDYEAVLVDLEGKSDPQKMMSNAPFAGRRAPDRPNSTTPATESTTTTTPTASAGFAYQAPDGWSPGRSGGMRKAAFVVKNGDI